MVGAGDASRCEGSKIARGLLFLLMLVSFDSFEFRLLADWFEGDGVLLPLELTFGWVSFELGMPELARFSALSLLPIVLEFIAG